MIPHKLEQEHFQLFKSYKCVIYNMLKILRNPSGRKYRKIWKSVMPQFSIGTHVKKKIMSFLSDVNTKDSVLVNKSVFTWQGVECSIVCVQKEILKPSVHKWVRLTRWVCFLAISLK